MAIAKMSGINRLITEARSLVFDLIEDPTVTEITPQRKIVHDEPLFPDQIKEAISVSPSGKDMFLCVVTVLKCRQIIKIRSSNRDHLHIKIGIHNRKLLSRLSA